VAEGIALIWRTDAHLSDDPPESRRDDWATTVLGKLAQVGEIARKAKALGVIDGGDLFHVKAPTRNSHALVGRAAAVHAAYSCPTWLVPGNHDLKHGDLRYLDEGPLGVLYESGAVRRLYDGHEAAFEKFGIKVRVVGVPYHGTEYDMSRFAAIKKGDEDWLVAAVHCLASRSGGDMYEREDVLKYADLLPFAPDVWLFGHWHKNQGIEETAPGKWVVNVGSLSRGSLGKDDLDRLPSCVVLKLTKDKRDAKIVPLPLTVAPAADVLDVAGKRAELEHDITMEAFVDNLRDSLGGVGSGSVVDDVREMAGLDDKTRERAIHYLELAS